MTDAIILPTADKVLTPALEKFYTLRPMAFQHLNYRSGVYWHPFLAFRAQTAFMLQRLAARVASNRLATAEGKDLQEYVASEYDAVAETDKTFAIGEVSFSRTTTTKAGDIPKGTRLNRDSNLNTQIPLQFSSYETQADVHFDVGQSVAGPVAIKAIRAGKDANHPVRVGESIPHGVGLGGVFDATIVVSAFSCGGGADEPDDSYVRRYASSFAKGQYGPTEAASRYGALRSTGVRNVLVYDVPGTGTEQVLIADSSWASSDRWAASVQQVMYDDELIGVGCKVIVSGATNIVVTVVATVALRDKNYLTETTEIDNAIRAAVTSYLNDRKDWNIWKTDGLKAAITRAHPKIFNCSDAVMKDTTLVTVSEITTPDYTTTQYHYYLANGAVKITYEGPS